MTNGYFQATEHLPWGDQWSGKESPSVEPMSELELRHKSP